MNLLKRIAFVLIQYRHFQAAVAELERLSDRELSDLGLTRGDIGRVAFAEAERRAEAALAPAGRGEPRAGGDGAAVVRFPAAAPTRGRWPRAIYQALMRYSERLLADTASRARTSR